MLNTSNPVKHSPYSLHLEHLATDAGLLVLHTDTHMYLSSRKLKLLGTVLLDPKDGKHYLSTALDDVSNNEFLKLRRLSRRAYRYAAIAENHTPS